MLFTLAGLLRSFSFYLDDITRGVPGTLIRRALEGIGMHEWSHGDFRVVMHDGAELT